MLSRIHAASRRNLAAMFAAALFAGSLAVPAPTLAAPTVEVATAGSFCAGDYYTHYTYYYDAAKTQVAGHGMIDCWGDYEQLDGVSTAYYNIKYIACGPHDHE